MPYVNPSSPDDDEWIKSRIDEEHDRIMTGGAPLDSLDRGIRISKRSLSPRIPAGWAPIPGQSRSGSLPPQTRSRFERREADGEIELLRSGTAWPYAWREITTSDQESGE